MVNEHFLDPNNNSGRFAELNELEEDYTRIDLNEDKEVISGGGLIVDIRKDVESKISKALVDDSDTNSIIVSSTGAGKTRRILSPYILSCIMANESILVHDPKGELYYFFIKLLIEHGYKVCVLNLRDPMTGDRYNFMQKAAELWQAGKHGRAIEVARGIAQTLYEPIMDKDDRFWTETAMNLFLCYFIIACDILDAKDVSLASIYRIHIEGMVKLGASSRLKRYLDAHEDSKCYELGIPSATAPNDTRDSIFSVFSNGIVRVVLNEEIADMMTRSTFDESDLSDENRPMALFVITRDEAPQTYSTVVSSIIDTIYTSLVDKAQHMPTRRLPRRVHFILEEFGNIGALQNINDMISASRSRGIRICAVVQSLCQLYLKYSADLARVLVGNFQNLVYMASTDMELVKMISDRCGTMTDPYTKVSRPLMSPDRLTHLDKKRGETLMLLDRHYPYITDLPDMSEYSMIPVSEATVFEEREKTQIVRGVFAREVERLVKQNAVTQRSESARTTDMTPADTGRRRREEYKISDLVKEIDEMIKEGEY